MVVVASSYSVAGGADYVLAGYGCSYYGCTGG